MAQAHSSTAFIYGHLTFVAIVFLLAMGWITVFLRLWVRLRITKSPGWDDATMLLSLFLFTSYCAFILEIITQVRSRNLRQILTYVQLGEVFYILTTTALKISLGLFFMRVLTKRWQLNVFRTILVVSAVYGLFYVCVVLFQCGSPADLALGLLGSKKCLPPPLILSTGLLYGVINVISDWTFVIIPIWILVDSDMDRQSKISVSMVMSLGAIGSVSSILRMVFLKGLQEHSAGIFGISDNAIKATFWATAEPGTGIIAASIAILRPLIRNLKHGVQDKLSGYGSSKSRSVATTAVDGTQNGKGNDHEAAIPLTHIATAEHKKYSIESIRSPTGDPWATDIEVQHAQVRGTIHVRMKSGPQSPPLKP